MNQRVAVLYQSLATTVRKTSQGARKPVKQGGYADSGADIAVQLLERGISVIVPGGNQANVSNDLDWVFPDTEEGMDSALQQGANVFWMNCILSTDHVLKVNRDCLFLLLRPGIFFNELKRKLA